MGILLLGGGSGINNLERKGRPCFLSKTDKKTSMFNGYSITREIVKLNDSCWIENKSQTADLKKVFNIDKDKLGINTS